MTERGRVRVEPGHKRVRGFVRGRLVFDTTRPMLVWETPRYPAYYVPVDDVSAELTASGETRHSPNRGDATVFDVRVGDVHAPAAAVRYADSPMTDLRDLVRFEWSALRVARGGRARLHPPARPLHAGRHPRVIPADSGGGRRTHRG